LGSVSREFPSAMEPWVKRGKKRNHDLLFHVTIPILPNHPRKEVS
jgi:hypothetical protein